MATADVDYTKVDGRQIAHYDQADQAYYVYECTDKLPSYFPPDMKRFVCNDNWIKEIPDVLPESLKVLSCSILMLEKLPEHLPDGLNELMCNDNRYLTQIPQKLPLCLRVLWCAHTAISAIEWLPPSLEILVCNNTPLKKLPVKLPKTLKELCCEYTHLTTLPELSGALEILWISTNIVELPDLPDSIGQFKIYNTLPIDRLYYTYPQLKHTLTDCIGYINGCNEKRRARERTAIINKDGALWECYMRHIMHPKRFAKALMENTALDIDEYIQEYINKI